MEIVTTGQPFSFNYTAYDQASSLYVGFSIYDVTTGTAILLTFLHGSYAAFGSYMGSYTAQTGKTYLVVGAVYTDSTYTVPDTTRAPSSDVYQATSNSGTVFLGFSYATYDQNAGLYLQASVYNMTSGSPVLSGTAVMSYVAYGVYFGYYTGTLGDTYNVLGIVYTDSSYTTVDTSRAPSSDEFDCFVLVSINNYLESAIIVGQSLNATLTGQSLNATLVES